MFIWRFTVLCLVFALTSNLQAQGAAIQLQRLDALTTASSPCDRCEGYYMPGGEVPHPETRYGIISDLPETFSTHGVLYSTREVLPENGAAPELLRQIRAPQFAGIDGSFDVFLFHVLKATTESARLVVHVRNRGDNPVNIQPRQVIMTEGMIGRVHEFESTLARRVLAGDWDTPIESVEVAPRTGRVIAYGKRFGNIATGVDASQNVNCFGYVRARLVSTAEPAPDLEVSVVAIPATDINDIESETVRWLDRGARSADAVPMDSPPSGCALRRAVGVYRNFIWKSNAVRVDVAALDDEGVSFPMALPEIQTMGCPQARQTADLVLHPGYTRGDTIGNYMIEHQVTFELVNTGTMETLTTVSFGKRDADIGLVYQAAVFAPDATPNRMVLPIQTAWAGPKQASLEKPFVAPVHLAPGQQATVFLRFMVCGNSSLPFFIKLRR